MPLTPKLKRELPPPPRKKIPKLPQESLSRKHSSRSRKKRPKKSAFASKPSRLSKPD